MTTNFKKAKNNLAVWPFFCQPNGFQKSQIRQIWPKKGQTGKPGVQLSLSYFYRSNQVILSIAN